MPVLACDVLRRLAAAYNFDRPEAIDQAAFLDALTSLRVHSPATLDGVSSYACVTCGASCLLPDPHFIVPCSVSICCLSGSQIPCCEQACACAAELAQPLHRTCRRWTCRCMTMAATSRWARGACSRRT